MDAHHYIVLNVSSTFCFILIPFATRRGGGGGGGFVPIKLTSSNMAVYVTFDYNLIGVFGDRIVPGLGGAPTYLLSRHCYSNA